MDLNVYLSIFIPLFGGVGFLAFTMFKTFNFYVNYFYLVTSAVILFLLGWNLALYFSNSNKMFVDWWFLLLLFGFLLYLKIIYNISKTEYYQNHGHEW